MLFGYETSVIQRIATPRQILLGFCKFDIWLEHDFFLNDCQNLKIFGKGEIILLKLGSDIKKCQLLIPWTRIVCEYLCTISSFYSKFPGLNQTLNSELK